jgi:hypothetical protein
VTVESYLEATASVPGFKAVGRPLVHFAALLIMSVESPVKFVEAKDGIEVVRATARMANRFRLLIFISFIRVCFVGVGENDSIRVAL